MTNQMLSTATDRVESLSGSIKHGLQIGRQYVDLLDQLCQTDSPDELLESATELAKLKLDNAFVEFPQHYAPADYYLLLMCRLLDMHDDHSVKIVEDRARHSLTAYLGTDEADCRFNFTMPKNPRVSGAFFVAQTDDEPLFYLDPVERLIRFSNHALVDYFIVNQLKTVSDAALDSVVKPLVDFAHYLASDLDFTVDYGILETTSDTKFELGQPELDLTVVDKLFVATTDTSYQLLNLPHNNGAELDLDHHIKLILSFDKDDPSQTWSFRVSDPDDHYSFFDILLHSTLVRKWYLSNRDQLAIRSTPLIEKHQSQQVVTTTHSTVTAVAEDDSAEKPASDATVTYQPKQMAKHLKSSRHHEFDDYDEQTTKPEGEDNDA